MLVSMKYNELIKMLKSSTDEYCPGLYDFINGNIDAREEIDSLTFIKFVVLIEEKVKVEFEDEKLSLSYFKNIDELLNYVSYLEKEK